MAVIAVDRSKVRPLNGAITRRIPAASTNVRVGDAVYFTSAGRCELADGDDVAQSQARGVVTAIGTNGKTTATAVGDMCDVVTHGPVELGVTGNTDGSPVYVSPTAGGLDQTASATTGDFNYIIGYMESDTVLYVQPQMIIPTAV